MADQPLLPSKVNQLIDHLIKIHTPRTAPFRVVSTESLMKEPGVMEPIPAFTVPLDLPLDQMTPQEKLHHVRALNRLYSSSPSASSTQSIPLDLLHQSNLKYNHKTNGEISNDCLCVCVVLVWERRSLEM